MRSCSALTALENVSHRMRHPNADASLSALVSMKRLPCRYVHARCDDTVVTSWRTFCKGLLYQSRCPCDRMSIVLILSGVQSKMPFGDHHRNVTTLVCVPAKGPCLPRFFDEQQSRLPNEECSISVVADEGDSMAVSPRWCLEKEIRQVLESIDWQTSISTS